MYIREQNCQMGSNFIHLVCGEMLELSVRKAEIYIACYAT